MSDQGWHPTRVSGVTTYTVSREIRRKVIGIVRLVVVILMAGKTIRIDVGKVIYIVTTAAILYIMTLC